MEERVAWSLHSRAGAARALAFVAVCAAAILPACGRTYVVTDRGPQAYYQTGQPIGDTSAEIERIFRAVKRVQVTGIYRIYRFALADSVTDADLKRAETYRRATERYTTDHSKMGTAAVLAADPGSVLLLTNAHVVQLADTLITHYEGGSASVTGGRYVESVAILSDRSDVVLDLLGTRAFRVLAADPEKDVAAMRVELPPLQSTTGIDVLRVPWGDPSHLAWASFVYVLGYPGGYRMVTRAIVSEPSRTRDHAFLLDGLFNRGMSGGVILGVRAETGALEWLGVVTSAAADTEDLLLPERREVQQEQLLLPYEGPLYLERAVRIRYGITFSVPVTAIREFLEVTGLRRGLEVEPSGSS